MNSHNAALPNNTSLKGGQYQLLRMLGAGGFACTYHARDDEGTEYAIKECFLDGICHREGHSVRVTNPHNHEDFQRSVHLFIEEASRVSAVRHPAIASVKEVFQENNTSYMVMEFLDGRNLSEMVLRDRQSFDENRIYLALRVILSALARVHNRGILHRDISANNIMFARNRPYIIDFGSAKERRNRRVRGSAIDTVNDGFSPPEFYIAGTHHSASSDLYSVGAVMYFLATEKQPPTAEARMEAVQQGRNDPLVMGLSQLRSFSDLFKSMILRATDLNPASRFQSADDWLTLVEERIESDVTSHLRVTCQGCGKPIRTSAQQVSLASRFSPTAQPFHCRKCQCRFVPMAKADQLFVVSLRARDTNVTILANGHVQARDLGLAQRLWVGLRDRFAAKKLN